MWKTQTDAFNISTVFSSVTHVCNVEEYVVGIYRYRLP